MPRKIISFRLVGVLKEAFEVCFFAVLASSLRYRDPNDTKGHGNIMCDSSRREVNLSLKLEEDIVKGNAKVRSESCSVRRCRHGHWMVVAYSEA